MFNLEQHNSQQKSFNQTILWNKPYGVCKVKKKEVEKIRQLPGTYFKIVKN